MLLVRSNLRRRSRGFTLVELMVSAALAITIMWILAESFKMGIDFARNARSTGDMMNQLNNAGQSMMRDLGQTGSLSAGSVTPTGTQHFLANGAMRNIGQVQMPDNLTFPVPGPGVVPNPVATGYTPPSGYFHVFSPPPYPAVQAPNQSPYSFQDNSEGFFIDTVGIPPGMPASHQLQFTAYLPAGLPQNQFMATCTGTNGISTYYSRAAEIAYFLGPQTGFTEPQIMTPGLQVEQPYLNQMVSASGNGGRLPLYNLYRRQRLLAVTADQNISWSTFTTGGLVPPNLLAPIWPTNPATGAVNPYYDATASDVISFTTLPTRTKNTVIYWPNTLTSFGSGYVPNTNPWPPTGAPLPTYLPPPNSQMVQATRIANAPTPYAAPLTTTTPTSRVGDDVVLSNVLSFEVLPTWTANPTIPQPPPPYKGNEFLANYPIPPPLQAIRGPRAFPLNSNAPFDYLPLMNFNASYPQYTFDTWWPYVGKGTNFHDWNNFRLAPNNPNLIPMPIRITGLQITVRIYDPKTQQARQNTWRVAL